MLNETMKQEEFIRLENNIWKTYQSRIKAATRLLRSSKLLDAYSALYTICLTLLSVFTLINGDKLINYFSIFISIVVMGTTFYGNTMNFKDRYINMKDNYLKLGDLYHECLTQKIENKFDIKHIYAKYSELLHTVENHTEYDYMSYLITDENERKNVTTFNKIKWHSKRIIHIIINLEIIFIPVFFVVLSLIKVA